MNKIGNTIVEEGIKENSLYKTRKTVRAVIVDNNKIYMLYSKTYNDYTFPGGGIKDSEDNINALKRELLEELGARTVNIIKNLGYIEELRYGLNDNDNIYLQTSYYYLCEIDDIGHRTLNERELTELSSPMYVDIDKVIKHNNKTLKDDNKHQKKGFKTVLLRENQVLKYIKNNILK